MAPELCARGSLLEALTTQTGCVMRTQGALPSQGFSSSQLLWADLSCGGEGWAGGAAAEGPGRGTGPRVPG